MGGFRSQDLGDGGYGSRFTVHSSRLFGVQSFEEWGFWLTRRREGAKGGRGFGFWIDGGRVLGRVGGIMTTLVEIEAAVDNLSFAEKRDLAEMLDLEQFQLEAARQVFQMYDEEEAADAAEKAVKGKAKFQ